MADPATTVTFSADTLHLLSLFSQYKAVIYVQLGIVIWEYLTTAPWEWSVLLGRKPFRKPMIIFFLARYSMWLAIIPNLIQLRTPASTSCRGVFDALTVGATLQVVFGQLVFILRCLAIWEWAPWVIGVFLVQLLPYVAFSFAIFQGTKTGAAPDLTPGMISCQISNYGWTFLVTYSLCIAVDLTTAGLMTWKVLSIRSTLRSSMLQLFLREGLAYSALGLLPAVIALAFFGKNENAAVRGAGLTLCSMLHAILGCRAFISLDSYAERLPTSLQVRVKNGEMLDPDTLARIAFHTGMPKAQGDEAAGAPGAGGAGGDSAGALRGRYNEATSPGGGGGTQGQGKMPWAIRLARLGQRLSPEEKGAHLRSAGSGPHDGQDGVEMAANAASIAPGAGLGRSGSFFGGKEGGGGKTGGGGGGGGVGAALGRSSTYTLPSSTASGSQQATPRFTNQPFAANAGVPNLDGIIISEQQVVEEEGDGSHSVLHDDDDLLDDDEHDLRGMGSGTYLASPLTSWEHTGPRLAYSTGRGAEDEAGVGSGGGRHAGGGNGPGSTISYEETELKEDLRRSP
ncbi:hypothetical protein OC842_001294 [Tilletia horrida]|uniref:Transmembrane protein n=1 Tax=Tilletia horrida TaxID=155126 RepID=A0AAN6GI50_9BASI|nr:hypothetical protein OC842_001294 [Tilletia horrida]KAK0563648.1 hypothetical protein OC844_002096 [Tilletia horrida]